MIEPVISSGAAQCRRDLLSSTHLCECPPSLLSRKTRGMRVSEPLMFPVSDDDGAIGELDLITRSCLQHTSSCQHRRGVPVGAQQLVTHRDSTHGGPAGWRRQGSV